MKRYAAAIAMLCLLAAMPAAAEVKSELVCDDKTLAANTTTDCKVVDISKYKFFSVQVYCNETTDDSMSIDVDWVTRSGATGDSTLAVPLLASGSAMSQIITARTTEAAWSTLQSVQPPVSGQATIRFTENNNDADIVCSAVINMGD